MEKGKNFSCNNVSGKRNKNDFYSTPYSITEQLLENESFDYNKNVLEPCSGKGAISLILREKFKNVFENDISYHEDFLDYPWGYDTLNNKFDYIITNPPFSLALEFIQKAKEVATEKFAMLLPLQYLHGLERFEKQIFTDQNYPLTTVYIFTRYPLLSETVRHDGKYKTGMISYMWAIWKNRYDSNGNKNFEGEVSPIIKWINNQKYILSKKDL